MNIKRWLAVILVITCVGAISLGSYYLWFHRNGSQPASRQMATGRRLWHCGMHPQVIQDHPGACPICNMALTPIVQAQQPAEPAKVLYWWDPMLGPSSITDGPGKSAMGMDLVPVYATSKPTGSSLTIDPAIVQNMGVRTAIVTRGPLQLSIRTVGMFKIPQPELYDVSLRISGWADKLYADTEGMHVHKGDVLLDLYSPQLQVASQELIAAIQMRKNLAATSNPTILQDSDRMVESAKIKFQLWGIAQEDIDAIAKSPVAPRTIPIRSPATGAVSDLSLVQGSTIQAGIKLLRIEGHSRLWLDAEVYENQMQFVGLDERVEAAVDAFPGERFAGKVSFIYPHVDHMTRTETVRTLLDNTDLKLKPGMYATVTIVSSPVSDAVLVPRESVIDTGDRQIAFVALGAGHFELRKVKTGLVGNEDMIQIVEGLDPGESVVTSGQFLMDVESRTAEAIEKLSTSPAGMGK